MTGKKNILPNRWNNYTEVGECVQNTRFLPFKVPLKNDICKKTGVSFSPEKLLKENPNLKFIIDLTNANDGRYYCADTFKNKGIYFAKIKCPGGPGQVPSEALVQKFYNAIEEFLRANISSDSLIGVHCTHGLNRTGYFICRYMIDKMNVKPEKAIESFQSARGHTMERPLLVNAILNGAKRVKVYDQSPLSNCYEYEDVRRRKVCRRSNCHY